MMERTGDIGNAVAAGAAPAKRQRLVLRRFMQNKLAVVGMAVIVFMYAVAILAPLVGSEAAKLSTMGGDGLAGRATAMNVLTRPGYFGR